MSYPLIDNIPSQFFLHGNTYRDRNTHHWTCITHTFRNLPVTLKKTRQIFCFLLSFLRTGTFSGFPCKLFYFLFPFIYTLNFSGFPGNSVNFPFLGNNLSAGAALWGKACREKFSKYKRLRRPYQVTPGKGRVVRERVVFLDWAY